MLESKPKGNDNNSNPTDQKNFLALATELISNLKNSNRGSADDDKKENGGRRTYLPWRFDNPEGATTKEVRGTVMRWCSNDCHPRPMWCGRKNCLNKAEYASKMQEARSSEDKKDKRKSQITENKPMNKVSNDFKIALAAMCSNEDYALLEKQFLSGN